MGLWPGCARAGAGCPGWGPDVRGFAGRRMSGAVARMSGREEPSLGCSLDRSAGFPGPRPDVRAVLGRMSGPWPDVRALWLAFCREMPRGRMSGPGGRMSGSWSCFPVFSLHQLVHDLGDLSIFKLFSEVVSFTPEHTKHTRLR